MWDFFQTVRHRHSIRRYQADMPVEEEKLHAILESATAAPSAGDLQSYQIVAVRDAALRQRLAEASYSQDFIAEAPISLVFFTDPERSGQKYGERGRGLYTLQDTTIAAAYAQLATEAAGLASTWVGQFDEESVRATLGVDEGLHPIAILAVGYPAEPSRESSRRRLEEVVSYR